MSDPWSYRCESCGAPSNVLIATLCRDCDDLMASPFAPTTTAPHTFLFAPIHGGESFCRRCGHPQGHELHVPPTVAAPALGWFGWAALTTPGVEEEAA